MGIFRLLPPAWRPNRRPRAGRRRPAPLRAEELEPRTLPSVSLLGGVAYPTYVLPAPGPAPAGGQTAPPAGPSGATPAYDPNQSPGGYWPAQIRHAYGFDQLTLDGSGQTIAIVDAFDDPNMANDVGVFNAQFNLPAFNLPGGPTFKQVNQTGGSNSTVPKDSSGGWELEEALDVEWAHAIAPKANILLVEANSNSNSNLYAAVDYARNASGVVAVSMSWGGGEGSGETSSDSHFTTPSGHAGVTFLASSGDNGAPAGYPATSPNVVAVGGTTLVLDSGDNRTSETGWSGSGGGYSSVESEPGYQKTYAQSSYVQGTLGNTVLLNTKRGNPDVALIADPNPGVAVYDTFPYQGTAHTWWRVGGTSASAPQWAGLMALVDQGRGAAGPLDGATQTLPALYRLAASSTSYPNDFTDVTSGTSTGTPHETAVTGYDLVTGLGAPRAGNLVLDLIGNVGPVSFSVTPSTANPVAGTAFGVTVTALDALGNTVTGYTGTVHFTTSDTGTGVALPSDYTFKSTDQGTHTFAGGVTLVTAGHQTVTATDTAASSLTGSAAVTVSPAAATHFAVAAPSSATAGTAFNFTVTAQDGFGNTATGYTGTVKFSSSDGQAVLPGSGPLGSGAGTFSATLKTAGSRTLTATDTGTSSLTGTSNAITVNPGPVSQFGIFGPTSETAGVATTYNVVMAEDQYGNLVRTYTGTVHLTSSDPLAVLPSDYTFTTGSGGDNGQHNLPVTFRTVGSQTVTVTDTAHSSITGTRSVTVTPVTFTFSVPSGATAGSDFNFTVTVKNSSNSTAAGYTGTVHFTSSDGQAALPGDYTFTTGTGGDNGSHTFTSGVTLQTAGNQTITATDTLTPQSTGTSAAITVSPAAATHLAVTAPAAATAGAAFSVTVTALDPYNNTATGYAGTVHFTKTDAGSGSAVPADYTFTTGSGGDNGMHTFGNGVTFVTAGGQTVTATDTATSSLTGSAAVQVSPAAATHFAVAAPSTATSGSAFSFSVTALDQFGNTATGYAGTAHFASSDGAATLPPDGTLSSGAGSFTATLRTVGTQTLSATDTANSGITGTSNPIRVNASAAFLKSDGATQGYWQGAYGGDGYNVVDGGAPAYPAYASVTPSGNGDYVWAASTADPRALQKPAAPADHVAAMWYSASSFTVDVNLTDGAVHQVALYLLDWDGGGGRQERVDVLDAVTGAVLDSQTAASFSGGEYLVWGLGGHVQLRVTRLAGPNAALSGLFFGPAGSPPSGNGSAGFVKSDGSTQGSWRGAYGGDGYNVVDAGPPSYPSYASVTPIGNADYVWQASTPDPRALQKPAAPADRIAAAWYAAGGFTVDVNLTDGKAHPVALYLLDWDGGKRSERVDVVDAVSGKLLDSQTANNFGGGEYLVWTLGGHVQLRVTRLSGPNAVLSGLFFGPGTPPSGGGSAAFLKSDGATQGYWQGAYGGDGYNVVDGGAPAYPAYASVTPSGNGDYVWAASTADPRALQKPANPGDRVAAMWYSTTSFTVDVNLTDGEQHQVALYLLDWDGGGGRSERIDVLDAASGKVLDSQTGASFSGGEYLVWGLGGHVQLRVTRLAGPNAVLSGLFFGPAGTSPSGNGSAAFVKSDAGTQGSWRGAYGGDGYNVVDAGPPSYPSYASVTPIGNADYVWQASTPDPRALQKPAAPADRIAAAWYAADTFSIDLNLTGGVHQVALYLLDWDGGNRSERVDVLDAVSGKLLDSRTVGGFRGGEYLVWDLGGRVLVRLTKQSGPNAVLSGLFFDPTA